MSAERELAESIYAQWAQRPKIVAMTCPYCGGTGLRPITSYSSLAPLELCTACRNGKITVEQT